MRLDCPCSFMSFSFGMAQSRDKSQSAEDMNNATFIRYDERLFRVSFHMYIRDLTVHPQVQKAPISNNSPKSSKPLICGSPTTMMKCRCMRWQGCLSQGENRVPGNPSIIALFKLWVGWWMLACNRTNIVQKGRLAFLHRRRTWGGCRRGRENDGEKERSERMS